ncbi:MAG: hypothetical protein ACKOW9_05150 [Candidatus Paceibacterota bacterium]
MYPSKKLTNLDLEYLERLKLRLPKNKNFLDVGYGWYKLLSTLEHTLQSLDAEIYLDEVTCRNGLLHIGVLNITGADELTVYQRILDCERASAFVCEVTGGPGLIVFADGRHRVLSPKFYNKDTKIMPLTPAMLSSLTSDFLQNLLQDAVNHANSMT